MNEFDRTVHPPVPLQTSEGPEVGVFARSDGRTRTLLSPFGSGSQLFDCRLSRPTDAIKCRNSLLESSTTIVLYGVPLGPLKPSSSRRVDRSVVDPSDLEVDDSR